MPRAVPALAVEDLDQPAPSPHLFTPDGPPPLRLFVPAAPPRLSADERCLLELLTAEREVAAGDLAEFLWAARPPRPPRAQARAAGRLRTLQYRLNRKLAAAGLRVTRPRPGVLTLTDGRGPHAPSCADFLRALLLAGPRPSAAVRALCARRGFSPWAVRQARRRLRLDARRAGFGAAGCWAVSLPAA